MKNACVNSMAEVTLQELHEDLETIKSDMKLLKAALLESEGEVTPWAKARIEKYLQDGPQGVVSQETMENEFL